MISNQIKRSWLLVLLLFAIAPITILAQSNQQHKADSVASLVKKYINLQDNPSLYALLSDATKKGVGESAFASFFTNNIFPLGQAQEPVFIKFENNTYHYKLAFFTVGLDLAISLGQNDKLDNINFRPLTKPAPVATSNTMQTVLDRRVDSVARLYIQQLNTVGLSIGIINKGQVSTYSYGETTKGNGKLPDANTIFEIGSITKTFTATLLAHYVLAGKVKLTDPITMYLPDSVAANKELQNITLTELSNHTSGLPSLPDNFIFHQGYNYGDPYLNYDRATLFKYLKGCKLRSVPSEKYAYSNMAVGLLGLILEKVSGKPFSEMITELICQPLGMQNTVQHLSPAQTGKFASVYGQDGNLTPPWGFDALASCGALRSTITDLLEYAKANMLPANTPLSKAIQLTHQVTYRKEQTLGLGWHIIPIKGTPFYFHNGGTGGSSSFLVFNSEKNIAVVVLSNSVTSTYELGVGLTGLLF